MVGRRDPAFCVYDKRGGEPRIQTPSNTFAETYFYTIYDDQGHPDEALEDALGKVERKATPIIRRWRDGGGLEQSDGPTMVEYLSYMLQRTSRSVAAMQEVHRVFAVTLMKTTTRETVERFIRPEDPITVDQALEYFRDPEAHFRLGFEGKPALLESLAGARKLRRYLGRMYWSLCASPRSRFFITSDHPACLFARTGPREAVFGGGIALSTASLSFPVSPHVALVASWRRAPRSFEAPAAYVDTLNKRMAHIAHRYVLAHIRSDSVAKLVRDRAAVSLGKPIMDAAEIEQLFRSRFRKK